MIHRGMSRVAFGQPLLRLDGNRQRVAEARMAIDQARLLTLYAAWKIDKVGALGAMTEIAAIKVIAPNVLQKICDDAIQLHGGAGVTNDVPLTALFSEGRMLRLADGPDEVHKAMIAKIEMQKRGYGKHSGDVR
jgi:alkylation response protein AidB-like acyl-CoA dehydrogenase